MSLWKKSHLDFRIMGDDAGSVVAWDADAPNAERILVHTV